MNERVYSSGYVLEYIVPRLCQKYTCSEWAWLYGFGYVLKSIVPLFSISTRNLHVSLMATAAPKWKSFRLVLWLGLALEQAGW